jgi:histone-lysine N-methyltransferase SETMAR
MKDALILHDNAQPHITLHTREAIPKMGWTVLPRPAQSLDLAPSDCHLFGSVKDSLSGCHFADDDQLKQSFYDVLQS